MLKLFLFLLVVIVIDFLSRMIIEMMHPWAKKALHNLRASVSLVLTRFETHITCIVLLELLRLVFCRLFSNFAEVCVLSIGFTEYAIS